MKIAKWLCKALAAGVCALLVLNAGSMFYFRVPVHSRNASGATEYQWERNCFYSRATEGVAWGRTNDEGFLNLKDRAEVDSIDILLMGSSHMEGFNVALKESVAAKLNDRLGSDLYTYNIGTSGHTLLYCASHLEEALREYAPSKYVILESSTIEFSDEELHAALSGRLPEISSHDTGLLGMLQKIPYLRLVYTQLITYLEKQAVREAGDVKQEADNAELLGQVLKHIGDTSREHGVTPILVYHTPFRLDGDGNAYAQENVPHLDRVQALCRSNGIVFVDMSAVFLEAYQTHQIFPYGFTTGEPNSGHLNRYGHALMAEAIGNAILSGEGE